MLLNFMMGSSCRFTASTHFPTHPDQVSTSAHDVHHSANHLCMRGGLCLEREHQGLNSRRLSESRAEVAAQLQELEENAAEVRLL